MSDICDLDSSCGLELDSISIFVLLRGSSTGALGDCGANLLLLLLAAGGKFDEESEYQGSWLIQLVNQTSLKRDVLTGGYHGIRRGGAKGMTGGVDCIGIGGNWCSDLSDGGEE